MKKVLSVLLVVVMFSGLFCMNAFATSAESVDVYVTIADKGTLKVSAEKITVADKNEDGAITIDEALIAAHDKFYEGGASAGYASGQTQYGISMTKLWGDTSGSFGYYLNDASALSLADAVNNGDYVVAFVYSDAVSWSDTYTFFDKNTLDAESGEEVTLTLKESGYDPGWNPVVTPLSNATITVNGEDTEYKTDNEGKVTLKFDEGGKYVVSAKTDVKVIVPPVCVISVPVEEKSDETPDNEEQKTENKEESPQKTESSPKTNDDISIYVFALLIASATALIVLKKIAFYEK